MSSVIKFENIESRIIEIRNQKVILDRDVAELYGVETKRINEAVKNNPDKFPESYLIQLSDKEFADLRSKISTTKFAKTRVAPKAFTEKGLYMIATILKSHKAVEATFAIIETFAKVRELTVGQGEGETWGQGDIPHSQASIKNAEMILGYKPEYDARTGFEKVAECYHESLKSV